MKCIQNQNNNNSFCIKTPLTQGNNATLVTNILSTIPSVTHADCGPDTPFPTASTCASTAFKGTNVTDQKSCTGTVPVGQTCCYLWSGSAGVCIAAAGNTTLLANATVSATYGANVASFSCSSGFITSSLFALLAVAFFALF